MAEPLSEAGFAKTWSAHEISSEQEDTNAGEVDANNAWEEERERNAEKMEDRRKERERQYGAVITFR